MDTRPIHLSGEGHCDNTAHWPLGASHKLVYNHHLFQTLEIHSTVRTEGEDTGDGGDVVTESARGRKGQNRPPPGLTPVLTPSLDRPVNTRDTVYTGNKDMETALQTRSRWVSLFPTDLNLLKKHETCCFSLKSSLLRFLIKFTSEGENDFRSD